MDLAFEDADPFRKVLAKRRQEPNIEADACSLHVRENGHER